MQKPTKSKYDASEQQKLFKQGKDYKPQPVKASPSNYDQVYSSGAKPSSAQKFDNSFSRKSSARPGRSINVDEDSRGMNVNYTSPVNNSRASAKKRLDDHDFEDEDEPMPLPAKLAVKKDPLRPSVMELKAQKHFLA